MRFNICGSFGDAERIYRSKQRLVDDVETVIHSLNMSVGYKVSNHLPDDIKHAFIARGGWQKEVVSALKELTALGTRTSGKNIDLRNAELRTDIEIERGNAASFYRDIFKFSIHHNLNLIDLGILITPNRELSLALGENIAWSGRFADELRISWGAKANNNCPILVIELVPERHDTGATLLDAEAAARLKELQTSRRNPARERYPRWRADS